MKALKLNKVTASFFVFAALLVSTVSVALGGTSQASAAGSYAGPVYKTYAACDKARVLYNSSFTRSTKCYTQYGWNTATRQNVFMGYSFTVHHR